MSTDAPDTESNSTRTIIAQPAQRSVRMTVPKPIRDELDIGAGDVLVARSGDADGEFVVRTAESVWDD